MDNRLMDGNALRERAASYRRRAKEALDAAVKESLLLLAEIDEEEARRAESQAGKSD
jgi:hypothetical protein